MKTLATNEKKVVPIFFAADENYLPYLTVAIHSLKQNASRACAYEIYVMNASMDMSATDKIKKYEEEDFHIHFIDVSAQVEMVKDALQLRDYYTGATYYRIFIAGMFPQYDKALYIDSDVVLTGDVSELFDTDLGDALVGAIPDESVQLIPQFGLYTKEVLGIDAPDYFNAGVLLMNLKAFRDSDFYGEFCALLKKYKFCVAQDQDYLNVLCAGRVKYVGLEWNKMPIGGEKALTPKLIHYNLTLKPWHYEDVLYKEFFWDTAKKTEYYDRILADLSAYTEEKKLRDKACEKGLLDLCVKEAHDENNYYKKYVKA